MQVMRRSGVGMRIFLGCAIALLVVYVIALGGFFAAMRQPPAVFGHMMSRLPAVTYILFPFEPMWLVAREGKLQVGDVAPDFALKTVDHSASVLLSSFRGKQPVVLVFGSHT